MTSMFRFIVALFACVLISATSESNAAPSEERRIALVIGNANYQAGALQTPANDAGLIAQTLQAAGFDVTGARDLEQDSLRRAFRDFLDKASSAGPETVAFVYLGGYGLQLEGENYFVPIDAKIDRDANVSAEALRLSDYTKPLAALQLKASVVVLDIARTNPFAKTGTPLAGGLALVEPEQSMLVAFNAAPGTVAPDEPGPYSAYAQALAEMMREGGLPVEDLFNRVRLRVNETTKGAQVPWNASKLQAPFYFFERAPDAPPPPISAEQTSSIRSRPLSDFSAQEAYLAAVDRDTLEDYEAFLSAYPDDPMARRVRAIIAARREALTWRHTRNVDTPPAYWSYLRRYPRGAHSDDARRRLAYLSAAFDPPPNFAVITYDVPPPPVEEVVYIERPVLVFDDPDFEFAPPPPPPIIFLPPRPVYFVDLPPPPPPVFAFVLPVPDYSPVPVWVRPPVYVAPPPNNIIYNNIHNTVVINNNTNTVTITDQKGQAQTLSPPPPSAPPRNAGPNPAPSSGAGGVIATGGAGAGAAALLAPSLPPSVAAKAAVTPNPPPVQAPKSVGPGQPAAPSQAQSAPSDKPSNNKPPGTNGQPLPPVNGKAPTPGAPPSAATKSAPVTGPTPASPPPSPTNNKPLGQALPGTNGQPLPPVNGKAPTPGAPPSAATKSRPVTGPTPPSPTNNKSLGQTLPRRNGQPLPPVNGKPPISAVPPIGPTKSSPSATPPSSSPAATAPPPPPPGARRAPPPPPPPSAARPAPPPAKKPCVLPNGQPCPPPKN